ncbi:NAD-dependent epimerase/dehydratase family protein [Eupransor demetentiae]|uniref:Nucleoside-diphosphate-sugar epimerase (WcaG) n=1 Tax=Eupransor demetentiae TaxID=3109584 RepID=A0ABM9N447_9LACO|nr:Nucleoside-diphosphate-sugar epimerase (WcaG) [Lactobacillaceae bacterium LMG 33000]
MTQAILGSNGQIGQELAKELNRNYTKDIRLVSRHPKKINEDDTLVPANLTNYDQTLKAVKGSQIVYFTAGLPMDGKIWHRDFPTMLNNVVRACEQTGAKLVFFDNTYMYPKNNEIQTEQMQYSPKGLKSEVRSKMASQIEELMTSSDLDTMICRAPEFYGPGKTQSITNTMIFNRIKRDKKALIPLSADKLRTLIWTPDASRAMALLANTASAYNQTWHLPVDRPLTYQQLIEAIKDVTGGKVSYRVLPYWIFQFGSHFSKSVKELMELLPRYAEDNIFSDAKFRNAFPNFKVTTIQEGIAKIFEQ